MWIHANENLEEIRELPVILNGDIEINVSTKAKLIDNTFSIAIQESEWEKAPIEKGHFIYCPMTEFGGQVTDVQHSTKDKRITLQGPTWRGLLHQRAIIPPYGSAYLVFTNVDANELIRQVVGTSFGSLFRVKSGTAGETLVSASFRYQTMAEGLQKTLRKYGYRLKVEFSNVAVQVILSAEETNELSEEIEISQDYGVNFQSENGNVEYANHCLALGKGELTARMVANVYRTETGYSTTRPEELTDAKLRTLILEYPNAETLDDLIDTAISKLDEKNDAQNLNVNETILGVNAELGDKLGVRDRVTGIAATAEIVKKIMTISGGRSHTTMAVETINTNLDE